MFNNKGRLCVIAQQLQLYHDKRCCLIIRPCLNYKSLHHAAFGLIHFRSFLKINDEVQNEFRQRLWQEMSVTIKENSFSDFEN